MGEAKKVERSRAIIPSVVILRRRRGRTERNEFRLGGMDGQSILAKSFRDDFHHAEGVTMIAKPNHESSSPGEFHPQALTEPDGNLSAHPALIVQSQGEFPATTTQKAEAPAEPSGPASEQPYVGGFVIA